MNVLFVSHGFQPAWDWGGPVKSMWNLAKGLASLGVVLNVLSTNARQRGVVVIPRCRIEAGVTIRAFDIFGNGRLPWANRHGISSGLFLNLSVAVKCSDIVHINGFWGPAALLASIACRFHGKPYIVSTRGNLESRSLNEKVWKKKAAMILGTRRVLEKAATLHFSTEMERQLSPQWARGLPSCVIPNPIEFVAERDGEAFRRQLGISEKTLLLGAFGRMHPRKNFELVLHALNSLRPSIDTRVLFVGPDENGHRASLESLATQLKVNRRIIFTGELVGEKLEEAYNAIDLLLLPAWGENFGNVVAEAASVGKPSIVSTKVGLSDWIKQNNTGVVITLDAHKMASVICELDRDKVRQRWPPERLASLVRQGFSSVEIAKRMLRLYENLLQGGTKLPCHA